MFWIGLSVCKRKDLYFLRVYCVLLRAYSTSAGAHRSSPSQVPTALLTTALCHEPPNSPKSIFIFLFFFFSFNHVITSDQ